MYSDTESGPQPDASMLTHPLPLVMKLLINYQQQQLQIYQDKLLEELGRANVEMLQLLGLTDESWVLNMQKGIYTRPRPEDWTDDAPLS